MVNSCLSDTPLSQALTITDKKQMIQTAIMTLGFTELWTLLCYQKDNFIVLTLNKADTMYFSDNIIMKNYSLLFIICQNTLQKTSGMCIFTSILFFVCTIVLASQTLFDMLCIALHCMLFI